MGAWIFDGRREVCLCMCMCKEKVEVKEGCVEEEGLGLIVACVF